MDLTTTENIKSIIYTIRGEQVMLDSDLAIIYEVETKQINKAVKRNIDRFPKEFIFQLNKEEWENLKFQFGTSSEHGGRSGVNFINPILKKCNKLLHKFHAFTNDTPATGYSTAG